MGVVKQLDLNHINQLMGDEEVRFDSLENLGTNVMVADKNLDLIYLNKKSREVLEGLSNVTEKAFGVPYEQMLGGNIGRFHGMRKSHIETILSKPENLPIRSKITIGDVILDLNVSMIGTFGINHGYIVNWEDISEKEKFNFEAARLQSMVDSMPINVMLADRDFNITYVNPKSYETLESIRDLLPIAPKDVMGQSIDIFHKNPQHQRKLLADPSNLPIKSTIGLGEESLDLNVSALNGKDGEYLGAMITWSVITDNVTVAKEVAQVGGAVNDLALELKSASESLQMACGETTQAGELINSLASQASEGASSTASATEELSSSIREISSQVRKAAELAEESVINVEQTDHIVQSLQVSSKEIEEVTKIIANIANQTNLLALNATIEAARAGEMGKGFAVVANEVKELAKQTSNATENISRKIGSVQNSSNESVEALSKISASIKGVKEINMSLASAIEEQQTAVESITQNTVTVSQSIKEVSSSSSDILNKVRANEEIAAKITENANSAEHSNTMVSKIQNFLDQLGWLKK